MSDHAYFVSIEILDSVSFLPWFSYLLSARVDLLHPCLIDIFSSWSHAILFPKRRIDGSFQITENTQSGWARGHNQV